MKAFDVDGVDVQAGTVVVEIDKTILAPIANLLTRAEARGNTNAHTALQALGHQLRNAAAVLYGEERASKFDFTELESDQDEGDEALKATG